MIVRIVATVVLVLTLLAAGCGSSEPTAGDTSVGALLAIDDLRPLVTISPKATGWPWPVNPQTRVAPPSPFTLDQSEPSYPIQKAVYDAYRAAGLVRLATSSWFDGVKKASSFANLVATPAEAMSVMEAEHDFARHWFPEFEHVEIRDVEADDIGEKSWACAAEQTAQPSSRSAGRGRTPSSPSTSPATRATPTSQMPLAAGLPRSTTRQKTAAS